MGYLRLSYDFTYYWMGGYGTGFNVKWTTASFSGMMVVPILLVHTPARIPTTYVPSVKFEDHLHHLYLLLMLLLLLLMLLLLFPHLLLLQLEVLMIQPHNELIQHLNYYSG